MNGFIEFISTPVATVLRAIHAMLSTFLEPGSGPAWGLSIVLLVIVVRLLLFPLFVKQIKSQRRMAELAPKVKELQVRHKGDRETLNTELMKLYKDNNANPISGCMPLILQMPVFFALFSVMNEFRPGKDARFGLTTEQLAEGGRAKVFGAPIGSAFNSSAELLSKLDGNATTVKVVAATMVVLMGLSTFWTQRQMMLRGGAVTDPQQQQIQKFMLYVLPFSFAIFGFTFPVGVLLYWLTTNIWSMGQQHWVIKRMPPVVGVGAAKPGGKPSAGKPVNGKPVNGKPAKELPAVTATLPADNVPAEAAATGVVGQVGTAVRTGGGNQTGQPGKRPNGQPSNNARRSSGSRKNKKRGRR